MVARHILLALSDHLSQPLTTRAQRCQTLHHQRRLISRPSLSYSAQNAFGTNASDQVADVMGQRPRREPPTEVGQQNQELVQLIGTKQGRPPTYPRSGAPLTEGADRTDMSFSEEGPITPALMNESSPVMAVGFLVNCGIRGGACRTYGHPVIDRSLRRHKEP